MWTEEMESFLSLSTFFPVLSPPGIKQRLLDLFLSYNPLWLRIGLETTYGEILPLQGNTDVVGLSRFVLTRLLGNPDIAAQYAHPTVPHLYGPGMRTHKQTKFT